MASGDSTGVLEAELLSLARDLAETLTQGSWSAADYVEALSVLVAVHWIRYRLLPKGQGRDDLQTCLKWSAVLLPVAPHLVPEPVKAYIADSGARADAPSVEVYQRGVDLYRDYQRTGDFQLLETAITLFREAVNTSSADHPDRPAMLSVLGAALRVRFGRTGQLADLDQAISYGRKAVDTIPASHADRASMLSNLGTALRSRFGRTGQLADLDQAITYGQEAVDAALVGHPARPAMLSNLGVALQTRFGRTGQLADLDQAITVSRDAVAATPAGHPDQPGRLSNLGGALRARFNYTGKQQDLDQAISSLSEAVSATPVGHTSRSGRLSNLGTALQTRFERTGQLADLDQAITLDQEAVDAIPVDHPDRPLYLSNFGAALGSRFGRTGQLADLDQAISSLSEAVNSTPPDHLDRPLYLANLGTVLQIRFGRTGQLADLDQAITVGEQAISATPVGHPDRSSHLSNLSATLQIRFGRTGQLADLDQAITVGEQAISATPISHPKWAGRLSNLGVALRARFGRTGELTSLDQAITVLSEAVDAVPADHPERPRHLSNMGAALRARYEKTGQQADLDQALKVFREGAGVATASPQMRVTAARGWGQGALLAGDPLGAVDGFAAAVGLLPLVAWHGLDQATREYHLREWAGLASDAAAAAVAAGDPVRAVELLEAGRSMLWTQALHLRQDLAAVQERAPELAAVLETSRAVLNASPVGLIRGPGSADAEEGQAAQQRMLEERRRAARDWDAAVDQIRQIKGFEHFLRPVPFTELCAAASEGPVVIVNASRQGSHALILTSGAAPRPNPAVLVVNLPAAPMDMVIDQASILLAALDRAGDPGADWEAREHDRHAVFGVLEWCWQAITEPVLAALGRARTPEERVEDWPRVWWCPTGPAAVLPLHAAGRHPRTATQYQAMGEAAAVADTVAGRVVSSYTPTLTALTRARARPAPGRIRLLAAGVPDAPDYAPSAGSLPAVPAELQVLASYLPPPGHITQLLGPAAIRQAVLDALPAHSWLHLSCHGVQHPTDASLSAFLLHDQPLTLAELAALHLRETDLAYLAACQTAAGDLRLLDEALHLAAAVQLAGYRHVLATLWSISDAAAPAMADATYARLCHADPDHPGPAGQAEAARAPYALHYAIARLRQACPGEPLLWAPYIHLGP